MNETFLTDTHAHIHSAPLSADINNVVNRALEAGVKRIVTIGVEYKDSLAACAASDSFESVYACVGVHPHDSAAYSKDQHDLFIKLAKRKKTLAIGEVGLDFYREYVDRNIQESVFDEMLDISKEVKKPVVIHNRETGTCCREMLELSLGKGKSNGGILHCFNGDRDIMTWALDNGFYISYAGQVTFKSSDELRSTLKFVPIDRILIETDCPYLSPAPLRGKTNEPAYVIHTFRFIANELNLDMETFSVQLETNFKSLFKDISF